MRHQQKIVLLVLVALLAAGVGIIAVWRLEAHPTAPATAPSPSSRPGAADPSGRLVTTKDIYQAPVPSLCEHPAGKLVDGSLPGIPTDRGYVNLLAKSQGASGVLAFGDLTGDGAIDAVAVFDCSQGGVNWPHQIVLYAPGPKILGSIDLGKVTPAEHAQVDRLATKNGDVLLTWVTYEGANSCRKNWSARLHWDGQKVVVLNLTQAATPSTGEPVPPGGC